MSADWTVAMMVVLTAAMMEMVRVVKMVGRSVARRVVMLVLSRACP